MAIGYLKTGHDRIEKDPDRRVREAIALVFNKFTELQTVRQAHLWMRRERLPLPASEYGSEGRKVVWKLPVYNTIRHLLTNPIYAGAYAFGAPAAASRSRPAASASCAASARIAAPGRF